MKPWHFVAPGVIHHPRDIERGVIPLTSRLIDLVGRKVNNLASGVNELVTPTGPALLGCNVTL